VYETLDELDALEQEQTLISTHAGPHLANIKDNLHRTQSRHSPKDNLHRAQSRHSPEYTSEMIVALEKDIINTKLVAFMLGVTPQTVTRLAEKGEIPGFKVGDIWRFYRIEIEEYIQRQMEGVKRRNVSKQI
jgi:excisionase family DNA binding protein